jgi:hypothetical protein
VLTATILCLPVLLGVALARLLQERLPAALHRRTLGALALVGCGAFLVAAISSWAPLNWTAWYAAALCCGWELGALPAVLAERR